ncbi:hypothetical protein Scep_029727 [Stephania cephalantha]|uniref:MADS-box domain-containing protein n=1 Tax=Stephania cephalantha TaxID=152367 RepID=A0AAP0DYG0_9MAGN
MSSSNPRKGKGRKKIEIKKIEHKGYMQVAFSRRRNGVFKKASELTTLCGAESAVIVFSPGGKPYSFGHPDVNTTIDRYLSNGTYPMDKPKPMVDFNQTENMYELNDEYIKLTEELEATKKRGEELKKLVSVYAKDLDIENLGLKQLGKLKKRLQGLQVQMGQRFDEIFDTQLPPVDHQFSINDEDMLFDDPPDFAPQANDLDAAPNNVVPQHDNPQYYNFNYGDGTF